MPACISPIRIKPARQVAPVRVDDWEGELERLRKGSSPAARVLDETFTVKTPPGFVPCGRCNYCLEKKRTHWSIRLSIELKTASTAAFLTLTYEDSQIPRNSIGIAELRKEDFQNFMKRLRKECPGPQNHPDGSRDLSTGVRYYAVGEYGIKGGRPHYHAIIFNVPRKVMERVHDIWGLGHVQVGTVTPASIHYTTKYVINRDMEDTSRELPFALMSRRPGIGVDYLRTHTKWHRDESRTYTNFNGHLGPLPRYYRDRIYTKFERAQLANRAVQESDALYADEISRLSKLYSDPNLYYDERLAYHHDRVPNKVNVNDKF